MPMIAMGLLEVNNLHTKVDNQKFLNFTKQIYNRYNRDVAYHNDLHGSDTAQHVSFMMNQQGIKNLGFNSADLISILVAALAHDVGHDGFNNGYHKKTKSKLYQAYGEQSI